MHITIIGTGISGLLLAQSLVRRGQYDSLRLVGPHEPPRPHRLSYWSDSATPFDAHTDGCWSTLEVTDESARAIPIPLSRLRYRTLRANSWAESALAEIVAAPRVEWITERVEAVENERDAVLIRTAGASLRADWVFSSGRLRSKPACFQQFEGWEVELPQPLGDRSRATLLDFRTPAEGDFRFVYALPLAPRRLFVEHVSYRPCDHAAKLHAYLANVLGVDSYRVLDRERGATPLFRDTPSRQVGRIVDIGVAGGVAKMTTGYALTRMWRDAEQIASSLESRGSPILPRRAALLYRLADHFFLDLLRHAPERIPMFMSALFSRVSGDAVLAFLDDRARLRQRFAVALSMPGWLRWWLCGRI